MSNKRLGRLIGKHSTMPTGCTIRALSEIDGLSRLIFGVVTPCRNKFAPETFRVCRREGRKVHVNIHGGHLVMRTLLMFEDEKDAAEFEARHSSLAHSKPVRRAA